MRMASFTSRASLQARALLGPRSLYGLHHPEPDPKRKSTKSIVLHSVEMLEALVLLGPASGKMRLLTRHTTCYPGH